MKPKIILAVMYALTTMSVAVVLEAIYYGEPITHHQLFLYAATVGSVCFAAAGVMSFIKLRIGLIIGFVAIVLSWPYFVLEGEGISWRNLVWFAQFRTAMLAAISCLIISTLYSLNILRRLRGTGGPSPTRSE